MHAHPVQLGVRDSALWLLDNDRNEIALMSWEPQVDLGHLKALTQALAGQTLGGAAKTIERRNCDCVLAESKRVTETRQSDLI